jgi:phage shock protein C
MTATATTNCRRFTRDADRAILGGVFAGLARHFGFNLCVTRLLAVIAFFAAFPFMVFAYIAAVLLVPSESWRDEYVVERVIRRCRRHRSRRASRRERRDAEQEARREATEEVRRRARSLEERLARIEKHVTSKRYQLDEEFRNL